MNRREQLPIIFYYNKVNIGDKSRIVVLVLHIVALSLLFMSVSSVMVMRSEAACVYNEFGISSCESPPTIYLVDINEKQVHADGVMFITNEPHSNISLVIPNDDYILKIHVDNADHKKKFSMYYIIKVSEYESDYTYQIMWKEIAIDPNTPTQDFEMLLQFEEGIYRVQAFLWSNLDNPRIVIASSHVANPIVKALNIDTITRYVDPPDVILLNSTQEFVYRDKNRDDIMTSDIIIQPDGYTAGNYGGLESGDIIRLIVSAERLVYGDITYFDVKKQEWIIVKQGLSMQFDIGAEMPKEQSINNLTWGLFVKNPNTEAVRVNITSIITKYIG